MCTLKCECKYMYMCTHMHTHTSQGSTYGPFLFARRARFCQRFVLLLNLREQTEKSLAGPSWETCYPSLG